MKNPWFKFYPTDWRSDEQLRMCSVAARGLWVEMLCLMHKASPYGHLLINGESPNTNQIAIQTGILSEQVTDLIGELEAAGVFSRTGDGVIYSRKMVRDEKKAKTARKNGKSGGNPTLGKQTENSPSVNPEDKPPDKGRDKPQRQDARNQIPDITFANKKNGFVFSGLPFEGAVICLDAPSFQVWFEEFCADGNEERFRAVLQKRDDWYAKQPYRTQQNWLNHTTKWLAGNSRKDK